MVLRWSVLAFGFCWLGLGAHDTAREQSLLLHAPDRAAAISHLAILEARAGGALSRTVPEIWNVAIAPADRRSERGVASTPYRSVFQRLLGRVPFRNLRAADVAAVTPVPEASDKPH
jgi:hypothetical protein